MTLIRPDGHPNLTAELEHLVLEIACNTTFTIAQLKTRIQEIPESTWALLDQAVEEFDFGLGTFTAIELPSTYVMHNRHRPAAESGYWLFDIHLSEEEWMQILNLSPEEQVVNRLRWGPQSIPHRLKQKHQVK